MSNNKKILLISENYVKERSTVMVNVENTFIKTNILLAQDLHIQNLLGSNLYDDIISQFEEYKDDYKECWDYIFLATDIEENLINNIGIELYPNPVSSIANVSYTIDKSSNVSVSIQNAIGETLIKGIENTYLNAGDYNDIINTASLVPGVYYCIIKTESNTISKKFVVMK